MNGFAPQGKRAMMVFLVGYRRNRARYTPTVKRNPRQNCGEATDGGKRPDFAVEGQNSIREAGGDQSRRGSPQTGVCNDRPREQERHDRSRQPKGPRDDHAHGQLKSEGPQKILRRYVAVRGSERCESQQTFCQSGQIAKRDSPSDCDSLRHRRSAVGKISYCFPGLFA
ncbi:hypothetical protein [Mesorhizobium sp. M1348]|uniref:hypothetical protein n=1 Tax=unclassified Mesorhizobium TaxID=325217 RepID=UPI003335C42C